MSHILSELGGKLVEGTSKTFLAGGERNLGRLAAKGLETGSAGLKHGDRLVVHHLPPKGMTVTTLPLTGANKRLGRTVKPVVEQPLTIALTKVERKAPPVVQGPQVPKAVLVEAEAQANQAFETRLGQLPKAQAGKTIPTLMLYKGGAKEIPAVAKGQNWVVWTEELFDALRKAPETVAPHLDKPKHYLPATTLERVSDLTWENLQLLKKTLSERVPNTAEKRLVVEVRATQEQFAVQKHEWQIGWLNYCDNQTYVPTTMEALAKSVEASGKTPGATFAVEMSFGNSKTTRQLTVITPKGDLSHVQGIDDLKRYMEQQRLAATPEGLAAGLDKPKGIVVAGPPGTGKSLVAEAAGHAFQRPVIRISPSDFKGNLVGESERNIRAIFEAIKGQDVVLWFDEIEKMFPKHAGTSSEGGVMNEMLTFLNENEHAYVVMTTNDPTAVAPELIRKGRVDEIFYMGLPEAEARKAIFQTHLGKRGWALGDEHLQILADKTQGFSGAEIEQAVKEGLRLTFFENVQKGLPTEQFRAPQVSDFVEAVTKTKPVSVTNKHAVDKIQTWAREVQARDAFGPRTEAVLPKGGLTEVVPVKVHVDDLGGFEHFKEWILERAQLATPEARALGLPMPKGVMLVGVQGSGKSLGAEVTASMMNRPLIKLSMAKIAEGNVAENLRKAIVEIQQAKNCVVLIDEFEKAMELRRVAPEAAGEFLTFLNEQDQAFIAATANDLSKMPPEYLRKGRFDEVFFVDLPNQKEREAIFKALLDRIDAEHIEIYANDLPRLANASKGFTGAEIRAAIESARISAFAKRKGLATADDILQALQKTIPASEGMAERVAQMRQAGREIGRPVGLGFID